MKQLIRNRSKWGSAILGMAVLLLLVSTTAVPAQTALTIDDVRRLALEFNRQYLSAEQDVAIAKADITKAWSGALPSVSLNAGYNRSFTIPKMFMDISGTMQEIPLGFKNSFDATVSARQALWQGGKVLTALQIAKLYKTYSAAVSDQVKAEVVYNAEQLFFGTLLARAQLDVLNRALESNTANLDMVEKQFAQGMVSEFEVLRARVERQNLLPQILAAESEARLSEKRLKSFLGIELEKNITLVEDQADTSVTGLSPLDTLVGSAMAARPEMTQANTLRNISGKAVKIARADYWPSLDAVGAYSWSSASDKFTLSGNRSSSWTAGLALSFSIFSGGKTKGDVSYRKAQLEQTRLNQLQVQDNIKLEVEEAWDRILQAKQALDIQGATIASAEEGLRIARLRYESGLGTQLEVLSAQTALTEARRIQAQALFNFRLARAGLKKASTVDLD
jgi:outer membrane protein